ncbi:MAG: DNA/RNA non-specific endonuclease [Prevotella sp.]|nr:DNA/RNA non-specific endonuclease [Prevotella sp.]
MLIGRKPWLWLIAASLLMLSCNAGTGGRPLMGGDIGGGDRRVADKAVVNVATEPADGLELPAMRPSSGEQILRRTAYTASYNRENRLPNWVAWHLTAEHTTGTYGRKGIKFREDEDVPEPRATDTDYYNSGYDRGHLCPSADCKWSEEAQLESFLFTNACPQVHGLNAGDWNEIEQQCRRWAKEFGSLHIVSGPILYKGSHKKIGRNKVVVPEAFFKVVLCMEGKPKAIGFIYKNVSGNRPKSSYVNTIDEVERITGLDFFPALPDDVEERVESRTDLSDWGLE